MKNLSKGLLLLSAVAVGVSSCSDDSPWGGSDSEGGINLKFASDARVMRQSRADDGVSPVVPDVSRFEVNLTKSDNSYSKDWSSIDGFNKEKSFPIGDYTLSAFFGDVNQEGFENPCFKGSSEVHVSPGAVTDVNVVATLANAMVSVRYTDEFKSNFPGYSAAVQTAGNDWVVFAQNEDRPAYISPGDDVKLKLTLTDESNRRVEIQPASFNAAPRHHYVVTIGVKDGQASDDFALDVVFDDDVVAETVSVSLGDELFTAPAPTLTAKGFDPSVAIDTFEYAEQKSQNEFHVFAFGGLKSATLTVIADNYTPAFGGSVELVGADDLTQKQLSDAGVVCSGFFRNADKMGVVNVNKFLENLPAGNYKVSLSVVDAMTRTSEPLELKAAIKPVEMQVSAVENVGFMADEIKVQVSTNCPDIKNNVKFQVPNSRNQMVDAVIKSVEEVSNPANARTRADLPHHYNYTLALEPQIRDLVDVTAKVGRKTAAIKVPMTAPEYTITPDAFARKVMLKVECPDQNLSSAIVDNIVWYNGAVSVSNAIPTSNVSIDTNGIISIIGLNPATEYTGIKAAIGSFIKDVPSFTTEAETNVPNGSFSQLGTEYKFEKLQSGGLWYVSGSSWFKYTNYCNILRYAPASWATLNDLTCYAGSSPLNTWFVQPSTFVENNEAVIRTVGYNHNGNVPSDAASSPGKYYNSKAPAESDFKKVAGELFLGSYSFDGSETRSNGIAFSSRPSSLSFNYRFVSVNGEKGIAEVTVYGEDGSVLATGSKELGATSMSTESTVLLSGYKFGVKPSKIYVRFVSSNASAPAIVIPSGSQLDEGVSYKVGQKVNWCGNSSTGINIYKAFAKGSELSVSNVKLGYEASSSASPSASKNRSIRK